MMEQLGLGLSTVADEYDPQPVTASTPSYRGVIWDVKRESFEFADQGTVTREFVDHPGAVAVLALRDDNHVLLQRQYRHPTGHWLWEIPAGLLDVPGEPAVEAAKRELAEEADLRARRWDVLVDFFTSPGGSNEAIRVFLARDLEDVPVGERYTRCAEEAALVPVWAHLDEAVSAVMEGRILNPSTVSGLLAAQVARHSDWSQVRPVDAPWTSHKNFR